MDATKGTGLVYIGGEWRQNPEALSGKSQTIGSTLLEKAMNMEDKCKTCLNNSKIGLKWFRPFCTVDDCIIEADVAICANYKPVINNIEEQSNDGVS